MRRRIIASLMAFLLLGSFLLSPVQVNRSLAGMEKADYLGEYEGQELLRGTGIVLFGENGTPGSVHYFYSDAYFADPSKTYDKHLSSYAMTLSAASGADANVAKILGECGFKDVETNDDYQETKTDAAGIIIGNKTINVGGKEQTVVPVVIRSRNYGAEWGNNFYLGNEGDCKGFSIAADEVEKDIDAYLKAKGLDASKTKFLITGHSRGAGLTEILAKNLTDKYSADQVYGYSFAPPRAVLEKERKAVYENIHTVINKKDLFLYFPMEDLGFGFYGKTEDMTGFASLDKVNEQLKKIKSEVVLTDTFDLYSLELYSLFSSMQSGSSLTELMTKKLKKQTKVKMKQEDFIQNSVDVVKRTVFKDRKHYSEDVIEGAVTTEEAIRTLIEVLCDETSKEGFFNQMMDSFKQTNLSTGEMLMLFIPMLSGLDNSMYKEDHQAYYDKLWSIVKPSFKENLSEASYGKIKKIWPTVINFVCELIPGVVNDTELAKKKLSFDIVLGTWIKNAGKIVGYHFGETTLGYMRAADDFYEREDEKAKERPETTTETGEMINAPTTGSSIPSEINGGTVALGVTAGVAGGFIAGLLCMYAINRRRMEALTERDRESDAGPDDQES